MPAEHDASVGIPPKGVQGIPGGPGSQLPSGDISFAYIGVTSFFLFYPGWCDSPGSTRSQVPPLSRSKQGVALSTLGSLLYKSFGLSLINTLLIYKENKK